MSSPYEPNGTIIEETISSSSPLSSSTTNIDHHSLIETGKKPIECPELRSSFLSQITFWWFNTLAIRGFRRSLTMDDLWELKPEDQTNYVAPKFDRHWRSQLRRSQLSMKKRSSLKQQQQQSSSIPIIMTAIPTDTIKPKTANIVWAMCKTFGWLFISGAIFKLGHDLLQFVAPQLLKLFIGFIKKPSSEEPIWHGYFIAALFFLTALIQSFFLNYYFYIMFVIGMRLRTSFISAIYRKALTLSNASRKQTTTGEIVNLMSVDAQRFVDVLPFLNLIWSSPLQIALTVYFLWMELGPSVLAGLAVMVLMIPINGFISSYQRRLQMKQMKKKDERVKVINELLNGIRVIKLYAWEVPFIQKVSNIRNSEIDYLKKNGYLHSVTSFLWTCAPFMVSFVTFAIYVLSSKDNVLDPQKAFVSLSLFNLLRFPLSMLPMLISMLVSCSVSITRLNRFLNSPQLENYVDRNEELMNNLDIRIENEKKKQKKNKKNKAKKSNDNDDDDEQQSKANGETNQQPLLDNNNENNDQQRSSLPPLTLQSINLNIEKGSLVAIVGHVGSGKSSLISALLGEMECIEGRVQINHNSSIAYVTQQAWIQNATLRDNILFGKPFMKNRYDSIIDMCALKPDIQILPGGDQTEIGEKGINLSGGQKQRVALARACYAQTDIILMDDPLSAVDSHVSKHIFNRVISNRTGLLKNRTRLLVTNNISLLPEFDQIIVLNHGTISETGTYSELMSNSGKFSDFVREFASNEKQENELDSSTELHRSSSLSKDDPSTPIAKKSIDKKLIETERTETGEVKFSVYITYFRSLTCLWVLIILFGFIGMQTASVFSNVWLAIWSNDLISANITDNEIQLRNHRLIVYGGLGFIQAFCVLIGAIALANGVVHSSRTLHRILMERIMRSPIQFFDTTPLGRIVNRFSKDIDTVDSTIPHTMRGWVICFLQVISTFILIVIEINVFLLVAIPLLLFYYLIQKFYVATSRQLKRLESVTRSPIYSHFGETLSGVSTIRAYGCSKRFIQESNERVDTNQRCYFPSFIANRWLAIRLEFCGNMITFFAAAFSVLSRDKFQSQPGFAGLIMTYAMSVTQTLNWLIRMASEMETNVVSVERIDEYCHIPTEREWTRPSNSEPMITKEWPNNGEIDFDEFCVRYRDGLKLVLNNICIKVESGEKVGIVGRTGAGKSTLTLALFRLLEGSSGRIVIDDIDISLIGLHELRSKLSIIPQDPVLFSGTIRSNLDPFNIQSDEQLWRALEHSHLKQYVSGLESGLDYQVAENGENLSVGQRQLICLARALLRKTKILILDEATAAIDLETDSLIQRTIRKEFADCTILTIAHRLNTIMDSDRVLVLDKGRVVEYESPQRLLSDRRSRFFALAKDAGLV
ncbi:Mrp-4p [Dermatophagoides pteronyssinus]|uniref:Mrp-4p n=1 Tax=Dermatophagoides pteronyssinus TaxID=6956 RepID=A0ABQ8ISZ4_DERPT|nr:Mrp-4p [Dermatophagoides pteronyssinus]